MAADSRDGDGRPGASRWWRLLPPALRELPADLAATAVLAVLTALVALAPGVSGTPLRVLLGLPFVLFLPGYALVAALFPERGEPVAAAGEDAGTEDGLAADGTADAGAGTDALGRRGGIDGVERVALSFGLSIAVVPLLGIVLNFTPWGIRLVPILLAVGGFTVLSVAVAAARRRELPPEERFAVPYREWYAAGRTELLAPETRTDAALNVLLAASVVLAVASVGYAVAVPKPGASFTEFYLLVEDDDGTLVAADYPTDLVVGEGAPLVVGVGNQERERVRYGVVVLLQRVRFVDNETVVERSAELDRWHVALSHNETRHRTFTVTPTFAGDRLRLLFLLYRDEVPAEPTVASSYRETHLWVNVSTGT